MFSPPEGEGGLCVEEKDKKESWLSLG